MTFNAEKLASVGQSPASGVDHNGVNERTLPCLTLLLRLVTLRLCLGLWSRWRCWLPASLSVAGGSRGCNPRGPLVRCPGPLSSAARAIARWAGAALFWFVVCVAWCALCAKVCYGDTLYFTNNSDGGVTIQPQIGPSDGVVNLAASSGGVTVSAAIVSNIYDVGGYYVIANTGTTNEPQFYGYWTDSSWVTGDDVYISITGDIGAGYAMHMVVVNPMSPTPTPTPTPTGGGGGTAGGSTEYDMLWIDLAAGFVVGWLVLSTLDRT